MGKSRVAQNLITVGIILSVLSVVYGGFVSGFFMYSVFQDSPFLGFVDMGVFLSFIHGYMALASFALGVLLPFSVLKLISLKQKIFAASLLFLCAIMIFVHFGLLSFAALFIIGDQSNLVYLGVLMGGILFIFAGFSTVLMDSKSSDI